HTISPGFVAIIVPTGVFIALATVSWPLALVLLPFLVAVALTPLIASKRMEQLGHMARQVNGEATAHMVDSIQGLRTIIAFNNGPERARDIAETGGRLNDAKHSLLRWQAFQASLVEALIGLGGLAVITMGATLVS